MNRTPLGKLVTSGEALPLLLSANRWEPTLSTDFVLGFLCVRYSKLRNRTYAPRIRMLAKRRARTLEQLRFFLSRIFATS